MSISLSGHSLSRQYSLRDQVYQLLRNLILTGAIKPGELIDEKAIATQLSISRTPVREAVKRLSDEYLVDVVAQSATRASQLESSSIWQAYLVRRALEMESAAQAALRMNQTHTDNLAELIEQHSRLYKARKYSEAIEIDDEFHRYIAMISDLDRLWTTIEVSKAQLDRCRYLLLPLSGQAEKTMEQHRIILRALNSGDSAAAANAMQLHLDYAFNSAETLLEGSVFDFPVEPKPGGRARKHDGAVS